MSNIDHYNIDKGKMDRYLIPVLKNLRCEKKKKIV